MKTSAFIVSAEWDEEITDSSAHDLRFVDCN